jgi:hypothetical protein
MEFKHDEAGLKILLNGWERAKSRTQMYKQPREFRRRLSRVLAYVRAHVDLRTRFT